MTHYRAGTGAQKKGGLRVALGKDALVRRLPNGSYGLWVWYPNVKQPKGKKSGDKPAETEAETASDSDSDSDEQDTDSADDSESDTE